MGPIYPPGGALVKPPVMRFHAAMACVRASSLSLVLVLSLAAGCAEREGRRGGGGDGGTPPGDGGSGADGGGSGTDGGPGTDGSMPPTGEWVDPDCVDGMYGETLPDPSADIEDLVGGYSSTDYHGFVDSVLMRRYPVGRAIVSGGRMYTSLGDCVDLFLSSRGTAPEVLRQLSTVVHECGHFYDLGESGFSDSVYVLTPEATFTCTEGDTTSRGGRTFARSRITGDAYASMRAPCGGSGGGGCDFYADIYLDGDPDDGTFDSGDQGFNSLLEETVQYVNSLATGYAFQDRISGSVSERDGILTFLWYVGRYLRMARTEYTDAYAHLSGDTCWRTAILTVWGRAWLFLEATDGIASLGIDDDELLALATHPDMIDEIERLRALQGCSAP